MDSPPRQTPVCCGPSRRASLPTPSHLKGIPAGVREGGEGEYATAHQMVRFSEHSTFGGMKLKCIGGDARRGPGMCLAWLRPK